MKDDKLSAVQTVHKQGKQNNLQLVKHTGSEIRYSSPNQRCPLPAAVSLMKYLDVPPSPVLLSSKLTYTAVSLPVQPTHRAVFSGTREST